LSLAREGGELAFRIENEGTALPEELLHWINEPGAGRPVRPAIGLTIVRRIIALHGYRFRAESAEGINRFEVRMRVYR
jgi:hypothetical protein